MDQTWTMQSFSATESCLCVQGNLLARMLNLTRRSNGNCSSWQVTWTRPILLEQAFRGSECQPLEAKTATHTVQDSHSLWLAPQLSFWGMVWVSSKAKHVDMSFCLCGWAQQTLKDSEVSPPHPLTKAVQGRPRGMPGYPLLRRCFCCNAVGRVRPVLACPCCQPDRGPQALVRPYHLPRGRSCSQLTWHLCDSPLVLQTVQDTGLVVFRARGMFKTTRCWLPCAAAEGWQRWGSNSGWLRGATLDPASCGTCRWLRGGRWEQVGVPAREHGTDPLSVHSRVAAPKGFSKEDSFHPGPAPGTLPIPHVCSLEQQHLAAGSHVACRCGLKTTSGGTHRWATMAVAAMVWGYGGSMGCRRGQVLLWYTLAQLGLCPHHWPDLGPSLGKWFRPPHPWAVKLHKG